MATLTFHLIPHTHWDREWYLPRAAFHARLVTMMDDLLDRLAADSGFRSFLLDGQTVLLEDYLRVRPERAETIRNLARAGRLQVGPWYVLPDELIPSGESLTRNLVLGAADTEHWGGRLAVLYSPDAFGHPACWPELARGAGLSSGVVWRGLGGVPGQEGDRYRWRGPSGAEVRLWHLPPAGYEIGMALATDAERLPEAWAWVRGELVGRAAGRAVPVFIGADHQAPPAEMSRLRDQLAELERPNIVRVSRLDEFFEAAADEFRAAPLLQGALRASPGYTWSLQGVHGTRAPLKRRAAAVELWLERTAEPLAALARWRGGGDYRAQLEQAWRALVQCQFHDTICGTTSDPVTREAELRLDTARSYADEVVRDAAFDVVRHDPDRARERPEAQLPRLVVWNPTPHVREGIVITDATFFRRDVMVGPPGARVAREGGGFQPLSLRLDGHAVPLQVLDRRPGVERLDARHHGPDLDEVDRVRLAIRVPAMPGFGLATLTTDPPSAAAPGDVAEVQGRSLVNRFVVVTFDRTGALMVYDRRTGGRWLDLLRLESDGDAGDAYTYCPPARDRVLRSEGPIRVRRRAAGPLVASLEARWTMRAGRRGRVEASLTVLLQADSPAVRCIFEIDNQATNHRLRARVPTGCPGAAAVGAQFGQETRGPIEPAVDAPALEAPVGTAPAHRFVAASDGPRGLAILAPGFFEYEHTAAGDVVVTLLRCVGLLSRDDLPTRPGHAAWPTPIPGAQCLGASRVELALAPLAEGDSLPALWESVFTPLRGLWIRDAVDLVVPRGGITLEGAGLVFSALKPAHGGRGDEIVLRCYNPGSERRAGAWRLPEAARAAHRARLDERDAMPLVTDDGGRVVRFIAEPHEIVTVVVRH
jgi:mannosylglycerate hydrolase